MSNTILQGLPGEGLTPLTIPESFNSNIQTELNSLKSDFLNTAFPIGFIYTTTSATNPSELFGGTWEMIPENTTLISAGDAMPKHSGIYRTLRDGSRFELLCQQYLSANSTNIEESDANLDLLTNSNKQYFVGQNNFSYLYSINDYYNQDGTIELLASWEPHDGSAAVEGRWSQGMRPTTIVHSLATLALMGQRYTGSSNNATSVEDGLYVPWESDTNWKGLRNTNSDTTAYLWGAPTATGTYYIGQFSSGSDSNIGILGPNSIAYHGVKLYARVDNLSRNFQVGQTYGAETVTLQINQMQSHKHYMGWSTKPFYASSGAYDYGDGSSASDKYTSSTGGGAAHNNMQPYIKTYIWKRVS